MTDKRVNLCLVGCGSFPYNTLYPMLRNLPVDLRAICDIEPGKLERFRRFYRVENCYTDYREMINKEKPGAVICVANPDVHYDVAKYCLSAGIHVFVEKTPCRTAAEAEELAKLQAESGKFLSVGFNRRYVTAYMLSREIIGRPEFGKIAMYYSKFNANPYGSVDRFVFNHIIHHIDLARYLLGELSDISVQRFIVDQEHGSGGFAVHFTALESGAVGTIQAASVLSEAYPMERLDIAGTGGNVVVDNLRDLRYNRTGPCRDINFAEPLKNEGDCLAWNVSAGYGIGSGIFSYLGFEAELAEFLGAVQGGPEPGCTITRCIGTMEVMEKVRRIITG
ncbi:MAG: Gfo/Idh/MocA family oxidoreductase [Treponema sp.]|jgi:predicted dehydrogenase|nr:Gfo/Idh/MocA family oxidoreductase [Treponema sp.]